MVAQGVFFTLLISLTIGTNLSFGEKDRSFAIDYENNQFLKDGEPYRYLSGAMHYFRVPKQYWPDRMMKMRAAGLNALETYIEWASHEPQPGQYNFDGNLDIETYFNLAQQHNLSVILRPGPFIDSERDMGGLPFWLLGVNPNIKLRTMDPSYWSAVERWFTVLLKKINNYMYHNGGPIIMVQVENEYGSYGACDREYLIHLRDLIIKYLSRDALLFSTDGDGDGYLQCGKVPGVYATVDFGAGGDVYQAFKPQSHFEVSGPNVNSEFYPGWLDLWGEPHADVDKNTVAKSLDEMLSMNASVNIYMFHGGTSFGFTSGALSSNTYTPCVTSYDYDAPLSEAGDPTDKYYAIRNVSSKYFPVSDVPPPSPKEAYGKVYLQHVANLWDLLDTSLCSKTVQSSWPMTFEALGQAHGYVLYCTRIQGHFSDPALLEMKGLADRGYVYVDGEFVGVLSRTGAMFSMPVQISNNQSLCVLVENQGRIAYGSGIKDFKGLASNVTLANVILRDWTHYCLPFNDSENISRVVKSFWRMPTVSKGTLSVYSGSFAIESNETLHDTFLHLPGWRKGIAFLNGINLGRYWPEQGPQVTLYVPKHYMKASNFKNRLVIVEQDHSPCLVDSLSCSVELIDHAIINGPTPTSRRNSHLFLKKSL